MRILPPFAGPVMLLVLWAAARPAACGLSHPQADAGAAFDFEHYVTDPALHRRWAVLADRAHPERPWVVVPAAARSAVPLAPLPETKPSLHGGVAGELTQAAAQVERIPPPAAARRIVIPGMAVTLWQVSGDARIELRGTAADSAALGGVVHVRIGPGRALLAGIVRGPGSVELTGLARQQWSQP